MSVAKIFYHTIIYALCFLFLRFIVDTLKNMVLKIELINTGVYSGVFPEISIFEYGISFMIVFLPLLLSSLSFNFFVKDLISKFFYWFIATIPILYYLWISLLVLTYGGVKGFLIFSLLVFYLILVFFYNYRMINKKMAKR